MREREKWDEGEREGGRGERERSGEREREVAREIESERRRERERERKREKEGKREGRVGEGRWPLAQLAWLFWSAEGLG